MKKVMIKYLEGAKPIEFIDGSDWVDLYTYEDVEVKAGADRTMISLGVSMKLPEGYEAWLLPRSSTYKEYNGLRLTNGMGIIDNSYCGDDDIWKASVTVEKDITIPAGTRLFQFRIHKNMKEFEFVSVDTLDSESRGGFGSTGK